MVAEELSDMAVLVTTPEIDIVGVANIFSENTAVNSTYDELITLSESLLVNVTVADELHVPQMGLFSFDSGELAEKPLCSELIKGTHQPLRS